ncbi:MAG: hypothetical protein GX225_08075 [Clostridiales bacterium]|nr:hypothetical protein [Clostridiales bacterium]
MKLDFKLAPKDKRLLLTLLIVVILIAAVIVYNMLSTSVSDIEAENVKLKAIETDLSEKSANRKNYVAKTNDYKLLYEEIINSYAAGLDQETIIMDLASIESDTEVWLKQAGLTQVELLYSFGDVKSTNPTKEGQPVYVSDLQGYSSVTTLSYECTYEQFKAVIKAINQSDKKYKIDNISANYSKSEDLVTGAITLDYYAVTGNNRVFPGTTIDGVPVGTDNIFDSSTYSAGGVDAKYLDKIKTNYDLYLNLNDAASDVDAIVVGQRSDVLGETKVSSNLNATEVVEITVSGSGGNYTVSYRIGDEAYPIDNFIEGAAFSFGDSLDLLVVSRPRNGDADKATARLSVINNTDVTLNIGILNDDITEPRCILSKSSGDIEVFQ